MGHDIVSSRNFEHRNVWIEGYLQQSAAAFGIDLLHWFFLDFSGKGEVRFRSFDLGTGRWIFAGIRSCVQ